MEVFGPFLDGYGNAAIELWEHLRGKTFAALDAHEARKAAMTTPTQVYERARAALYRKDVRPSMLVHGVLKAFDLPDLVPLFAGRDLNVEHAAASLS